MKKLVLVLTLLVICFAVSMAIAETVTIPKTITVPETFDQVPEQYKDLFDEFFWLNVTIDESRTVTVVYNFPEGAIPGTSITVPAKVAPPNFANGSYGFMGINGKGYSYFSYHTYNDDYVVNLFYTMKGELFMVDIWDKSKEVYYSWEKDGDWPIRMGFGDNVIRGEEMPVDLSLFEVPTIVYEEPLVLFRDDSEEKQGLVYEDGIFKYYENGKVSTEKFGFVSFEGASFMVANGAVALVNGLVQDPDDTENWYFCAGGQVQSVTSLVEYDNEWFFVKEGKLDTNVSGYVEYNGGLFYIAAGKLMKQVNGLAQDPLTKEWYFCSQGQVQSEYTGLAQYDGAWFYVQNGKFDPAFNGTITYDSAEFTIVAGQPVL